MNNSYKYTRTTTVPYQTEGNYPVTSKAAESSLQGQCFNGECAKCKKHEKREKCKKPDRRDRCKRRPHCRKKPPVLSVSHIFHFNFPE